MLYDRAADQSDEKEYQVALSGQGTDAHHHLVEYLAKLGYEMRLYGVYDDVKGLIAELETHPQDIVFNL